MSIMDLIEKGKKVVNKRQEEKALKNKAIGATLGLAVGAAVGVLLTPKSGKETREDIANAAKELPVKAKEVLEMAKEKVEEAKEKLKETKAKFAEEIEELEVQEIKE
ncbi:MAG: YtxH domain-containing protein [Sporomusaceae bacterium]|nr:YtxH domain-containing protein [Sporomusaceae bacterium]